MLKIFTTVNYAENIYLYYDEKTKDTIMFDPGQRIAVMEEFIEEEKLNIKAIFITHGHGDHIGAVEYYTNKYGADVYANEIEKDILINPEYNHSPYINGRDISVTNVSFFNDKAVYEFGDLKVECIHTPGHTHGSTVYRIEHGLIVGDTIFKNSIGRYDLYSGDYYALKNSIVNVIYNLDDSLIIYPGHGEPTSIAYEKKNNMFFKV